MSDIHTMRQCATYERGVQNQHSVAGMCPLCAEGELTRLRGIEAAVCSPYGKIAFPYTAEKAIKTLERWVSEIDSERGNSHGGSHLTNWMRAIADALEKPK